MRQIILGGITRLSGAGLSITEWKPIMGVLPPLSDQQWAKAFNQYQSIAQYKFLNFNFTVTDFKHIFFWEWFHRLWARLLGVVFILPFLYFLYKKYFSTVLIKPLMILFLLGGLQGFVGWLMVATGLEGNNVYVHPLALVVHLVAALLLLSYTFWFALSVRYSHHFLYNPSPAFYFSLWLLVLLLIQIVFGGLMAGLKASMVSSTWPTINGDFIPIKLFPSASAIFYNPITVQFLHRNMAFIVTLLTIAWMVKTRGLLQGSMLLKYRKTVLFFVGLQIVLGICTIRNSHTAVAHRFGVYEWLAVVHQTVAMLLFISLLGFCFFILNKKQTNL